MSDVYCSMIHGGLHLNFKNATAQAQHCCLRKTQFLIDSKTNFWQDSNFVALREKNKTNTWDSGCSNCERLEASGQPSMRTGMNHGLEIRGQTDLAGPARIDLMFDIGCNLACRTCGPQSSTLWQKHLKQHNMWQQPIHINRHSNDVINSLQQLDLSNLRQVVFCGGETMLGQSYWDIAEWLANNVVNAQQQLTVCFQTNGTQPMLEKNIKTVQKLHLVKLHVSLDGVGQQFEYLRWPAQWDQVTENLKNLKNTAPSNVMFVVEETISIFNLWYTNNLSQWVQQNFTHNREGDPINHTKHLAHGDFALTNCSAEYVSALQSRNDRYLVPAAWKENPVAIANMIQTIHTFDRLRNQSFAQTFPEVADFYHRFLKPVL